jgi:hypothetical protein
MYRKGMCTHSRHPGSRAAGEAAATCLTGLVYHRHPDVPPPVLPSPISPRPWDLPPTRQATPVRTSARVKDACSSVSQVPAGGHASFVEKEQRPSSASRDKTVIPMPVANTGHGSLQNPISLQGTRGVKLVETNSNNVARLACLKPSWPWTPYSSNDWPVRLFPRPFNNPIWDLSAALPLHTIAPDTQSAFPSDLCTRNRVVR